MLASEDIPEKMAISLAGKRMLYKSDLMLLEMLATNNWERPIYIAISVGEENYLNLGDNFVREGLVDRIPPFNTKAEGTKNFDTEKTYNNVMNRFKYGGVKTKGIYLDETVKRMCYTHRQLMATLALRLIDEGKNDKALAVLKKSETELPFENVPLIYVGGGLDMAKAYARLGMKSKAIDYINALWKNSTQYLEYYLSLNSNQFALSMSQCLREFYMLGNINQATQEIDSSIAEKQMDKLELYQELYEKRGGTFYD